ncbi:PAS domain-containing sensor histidine kinase [Flavobacterium reichenbachii]|uniref:PAS domain-containing sensor histidine kinase n=1 Tax=Flavobacterium reichenbachii TaxID=362418 RepID=UPI000690C515|nr:PAS domain S-box protein [Flavobacterium reichenbachii]OXB10707.1 PAS domain-containing sensor histidine kinase [Flavobacterium reichenbachii]
MDNQNTAPDYFFLQNGREAASIIKNIDWSLTTLGVPEKWPESLKNTLATILSSKFPMFLWWGDDLIQFYNDAYRPILGNEGKHPKAIGQKAIECWTEMWDFIYPLITKVLTTGESIWYEDLLVPIYRNGRLEDGYWTFSYSPVRDDERNIKGVLVVCNETTDKINYYRKLKENKDELEFAINAAEFGTFDLNPITNRFAANSRLKEWFGLKADDEILLSNATAAIAESDRQRVINSITESLKYESGGKYDIEYNIINPDTKKQITVHALGKSWFDESKNAYRLNGTVQDITAHKKAAEELLKSRQLTDLTIKSLGLGLFNVNFDDNSIDYSPEFSIILSGTKKHNLTRRDFLKYVHPEDLVMRSEAMKKGFENGTFYYTPRVVWDDGSIHRIAISASRMINSEGKPLAFSGSVADITEQEKNRLALEQAESNLKKNKLEADTLFQNVTDSSPTGLWLSNKEGTLTYFNKTLVEFTGFTAQELLSGGWSSVIIEEDLKTAVKVYLEAIPKRYHFDVLFRARKKTGEIIWCRAAGDPFYDADGEYAGYAGFCMDMDEIILGRKALAESEKRISLMIEQSPVAICLFTGSDMKIEIANDIMIGYWGKNKSVIGKPLQEGIPELKGQPFADILHDVYQTGETYYGRSMPADLEINGVLSTHYFDFTYTPIRDSKGEIYGIMNIAINITNQVIASKKLDETRIALAGAIELAELATWRIDIATGFIVCSTRFKHWLGLDTHNTHKDEVFNLIADTHRQKVIDSIEETLKPGSSDFYDYEFPIINKLTGQVRIIHANAQVIYGKDNAPECLSGTAQDVTKERELKEELKFKVKERTQELHAANAELEINNQELKQFAYIASHDLQEPVRKISVFTEMLQNNLEKNPQKVQMYIDKIINSTKRMENLIKDVLGFSQLSSASKNFESVNLNDIVKEIINDFDLTIEQKNASLFFNNLPVIEAIPLQMSQLFGNLISNALKYSKPDMAPIISITSEKLSESNKHILAPELNAGEYVKIEIKDNGIGFSQNYAEQIFNIFQRLHGKDEFAGTGIGLAMCRKILHNHNGKITAASEESVGTTFTIIIPFIQDNSSIQ